MNEFKHFQFCNRTAWFSSLIECEYILKGFACFIPQYLNKKYIVRFAGSVSERGSVAAECRWSDWSNCSYFCGDPRVETKFKSLVEVVPKGEAAQCAIPQEKCAVDCTGEEPCT